MSKDNYQKRNSREEKKKDEERGNKVKNNESVDYK